MNNHAAGPLSVGVRTPPGTTLPTPWQVNNRAHTRRSVLSGRRQFGRDDDPDPDVPRDCYAWRWPPMRTGRFLVQLRLEQPSTPLREPPAVMPTAQPAKFPGVAQLDVSHFAKLLLHGRYDLTTVCEDSSRPPSVFCTVD
jgi:hypothetical protein